ncbi:hypothetical protein OAR92_03520 [Porticoccaceae bacterium]|nr:hypothetical protein [Porticoccaceae bacterium]
MSCNQSPFSRLNILKKLLLALLLISPLSFADWGDVYYCQETSYAITGHDGKLLEVELGKFQFKLDETKNAMVFGSSGTLKERVLQLREASKPGGERWVAENIIDRVSFDNGGLLYTLAGRALAFMMSAECDKF